VIRRLRLSRLHGLAEDVRLLAVSDETDKALDVEANRAALGGIDGIVGAGDLEPDYLAFLADAFNAPLVYVRGNHDRGENWTARSSADSGSVGCPGPAGRAARRFATRALPGARRSACGCACAANGRTSS
jgi:hypothetical protein